MPSYKGGMTEAPSQVTEPSDASKSFITNKDGIVYPKEISRKAKVYQENEGSMGFDRNQGVKRDAWESENDYVLGMGQDKLQRLKESSLGSKAI